MLMRSRSLRPRALAAQGQQRARDRHLVGAVRQCMRQNEPVKCSGAGSRPRLQHRNAPARFQEIKLAMKTDAVAHAQPRVKIQQVDAAAQQDVLAIVDGFRLALAPRRQVDRRWRVRPGTAAIRTAPPRTRRRPARPPPPVPASPPPAMRTLAIRTYFDAETQRRGDDVEQALKIAGIGEPDAPSIDPQRLCVSASKISLVPSPQHSARIVSIVSASSALLSRRQRAMRGNRTAIPDECRADC